MKKQETMKGHIGDMVRKMAKEEWQFDENGKKMLAFKRINENAIIATDQAMLDRELLPKYTNPREGVLSIWVLMYNNVWEKWSFAPVMSLFAEPLTEDIVDEDGRVIEGKSTHKIDDFYGSPISGKLDLRRFLEGFGVTVEKL